MEIFKIITVAVVILVLCMLVSSTIVETTRLRIQGRVEIKRLTIAEEQRPDMERGLANLSEEKGEAVTALAIGKLGRDMAQMGEEINANVIMKNYYDRIGNTIQRTTQGNSYEGYDEDIQKLKEFISVEEGAKY